MMTPDDVLEALREYTGSPRQEFHLISDPQTEAWAARDEYGNHYVVHSGPQKPWERVEEVRFSCWPPKPGTF